MLLWEKDELKKEQFGNKNLEMYREAKFSGLENKTVLQLQALQTAKDSQNKKCFLVKAKSKVWLSDSF